MDPAAEREWLEQELRGLDYDLDRDIRDVSYKARLVMDRERVVARLAELEEAA